MDAQVNDGDTNSVEDTVRRMTCAQLIEALRSEIPDERYKAELEILEAEKIDGALFLDLPEDPDLKEVFDMLSGGGKAKIRKVVRGIKNGSLKFGQAAESVPKLKLVEPDKPWCTTETPDDPANGSANGNAATDSGMQSAWIPADAVWPWKDRKEIYVEFLNVGLLADWTISDGQPMNTDTVLRYANTWSEMGGGMIPRFVEATGGKQAQIRVSFNNKESRKSELGKRAQLVKAPIPTMHLDLHNGCPDDDYKKHLIIHEFGHALGLGHEHQRSNFWTYIEQFIDIEEMKKDLKVNEKKFKEDWKEIGNSEEGHRTPDYDADSIMHYWCKVTWLTHGYSDKAKVEKDHKRGVLSDKVARALLGVHKRHRVLATKPSPMDIQLLQQVYGGAGGTQGSAGPEPIEQNYDDPALSSPNPRTGGPTVTKRVTADSGVIAMDTQTGESSVAVVPKRQKIFLAEEPNELMFEQEYDVELTNAYLSRMSWTEDGKKRVVKIYDEAGYKWREIGELLGIDEGVLISIGRDGYSDRDRVIKVLGKWYENASGLPHCDEYPRTWGGLLRLLVNVGLWDLLAKRVHKALLQQQQSTGRGSLRVMAGGPPPPPSNGQIVARGLCSNDLGKVNNAVRAGRSKWYSIGLELDIGADDLDSIRESNREDPEKCLTDVLKLFLRQVSPRPSWQRLADAMASSTVGRGDIAEDLKQQYC